MDNVLWLLLGMMLGVIDFAIGFLIAERIIRKCN